MTASKIKQVEYLAGIKEAIRANALARQLLINLAYGAGYTQTLTELTHDLNISFLGQPSLQVTETIEPQTVAALIQQHCAWIDYEGTGVEMTDIKATEGLVNDLLRLAFNSAPLRKHPISAERIQR